MARWAGVSGVFEARLKDSPCTLGRVATARRRAVNLGIVMSNRNEAVTTLDVASCL